MTSANIKGQPLKLFHYWRSSSSWRVRWALDLKGLSAEMIAVDLLSGESESETHLQRNPLGYVPALQWGDKILIESVAIVEWLDEMIPASSLYPGNSLDRAHIRSLVELINSDTQPIQNLSVVDKYSNVPERRKEWMQYFIRRGLSAYEKLVSKSKGRFSVGDQLTAADLFLIPQCYNALRNQVDLAEFPLIEKIHIEAGLTDSMKRSHPDRYAPGKV